MKWTKALIQTLRENPGDAEIDSHKLLVRAGLVKKMAGGLYTYLPLGLRTLKKIENIVREEMNRAGAQEIVMPILQTAELWKESGRWDSMGPNMFKVKDRARHDYALAPTAEEAVVDVARSVISSYRQLPVTVYQIQWKFRDEIRPRFGLMRSKEFLMKDAYSFDTSMEAADGSYEAMYEAYKRIFSRCGLAAVPVEADTGDIGGKSSHEFHVLAEAGEDGIAACKCGYAANLEKASRSVTACEDEACPEAEIVPTPGAKTIEEVSRFMGLPASKFVKSLIYMCDGKPVMVCVAGDREVNEIKLKHFLDVAKVELATTEDIIACSGASAGSVGPVKPSCESMRIVADFALKGTKGVIVGANIDDNHFKNVDLARDTKLSDDDYADLTIVAEGDICPKCGAKMSVKRGIEVGHVFKLGVKYTQAMKAVYKTKDINEEVMVMGCYGIGVGRTLQAIIEQSHDKDGIIWPSSVSPYQVVIENLDPSDAKVTEVADRLEAELEAKGVDVIVDDREERPGVKFKDADLIGFTLRVVVGAKGLSSGGIEVKRRDEDKSKTKVVPVEGAIGAILDSLK